MLQYERREMILSELGKVDDVLTIHDLTDVLVNYFRLFDLKGSYIVGWNFVEEEVYDDVYYMRISEINVTSSLGEMLNTYEIFTDIYYADKREFRTTSLQDELVSILNGFGDDLYETDVYSVLVSE